MSQEDGLISKRVLEFFGPLVAAVKDPLQGNEGIHPLDVVQRSVGGNRRQCRESAKEYSVMPCASDLHEAGIYFKLSPAPNGFVEAVRFGRGVLSIPRMTLYDNAERVFLNLMAFERLHPGAGNDVTEFVYLNGQPRRHRRGRGAAQVQRDHQERAGQRRGRGEPDKHGPDQRGGDEQRQQPPGRAAGRQRAPRQDVEQVEG